MSFSPSSMTQADLERLADRFSRLVCAELPYIDKNGAKEALANALGHRPQDSGLPLWSVALDSAPRDQSQGALKDPETRRLLWRLLSTQLRCGISTFDALGAIQEDHEKLGFASEMADFIGEVRQRMQSGGLIGEILAKYVMPYDFREGATLLIGSKLSSFQDAMSRLSRNSC